MGEDGVGEGGNEGDVAVVAAVPQAEEGRQEAGDDQDPQQDDQRCREGWR